jgi:hypothetical protein
MRAALIALLIPFTAHAGPHDRPPLDSVYIMVCRNAEGVFFVRPTGIIYSMQGMNGAPNCMAVLDTDGKDHVLCHVEGSPDICRLERPRGA